MVPMVVVVCTSNDARRRKRVGDGVGVMAEKVLYMILNGMCTIGYVRESL